MGLFVPTRLRVSCPIIDEAPYQLDKVKLQFGEGIGPGFDNLTFGSVRS